MKGIIALCLLVTLSGCSAIQLNPVSSGKSIYRTPAENVTAQLVLPQPFQEKVLVQKPSFGTAWGPREFEIHAGQPLSNAMAGDIKSRIPSARIGNTPDGKPATIRVTAQDVSIEFGVDDAKALGFIGGFGLLGTGSGAVVAAKARVSALVSIDGGTAKRVEAIGSNTMSATYLSITESDVSKVIGLALDDAALKIGDIAEAEIRK